MATLKAPLNSQQICDDVLYNSCPPQQPITIKGHELQTLQQLTEFCFEYHMNDEYENVSINILKGCVHEKDNKLATILTLAALFAQTIIKVYLFV